MLLDKTNILGTVDLKATGLENHRRGWKNRRSAIERNRKYILDSFTMTVFQVQSLNFID
jgi:hypothetical protein